MNFSYVYNIHKHTCTYEYVYMHICIYDFIKKRVIVFIFQVGNYYKNWTSMKTFTSSFLIQIHEKFWIIISVFVLVCLEIRTQVYQVSWTSFWPKKIFLWYHSPQFSYSSDLGPYDLFLSLKLETQFYYWHWTVKNIRKRYDKSAHWPNFSDWQPWSILRLNMRQNEIMSAA